MHQDFKSRIQALTLIVSLAAAPILIPNLSDAGDVFSPSAEELESRLHKYRELITSISDSIGEEKLYGKLSDYVADSLLSHLASKREFSLRQQISECSIIGLFECHKSIDGILHVAYKGQHCSALIGESATMDLVTTVYWTFDGNNYKIAMVNVKYFDQWFDNSEQAMAAVASTCNQIWNNS